MHKHHTYHFIKTHHWQHHDSLQNTKRHEESKDNRSNGHPEVLITAVIIDNVLEEACHMCSRVCEVFIHHERVLYCCGVASSVNTDAVDLWTKEMKGLYLKCRFIDEMKKWEYSIPRYELIDVLVWTVGLSN